jgi:hypothetical protein
MRSAPAVTVEVTPDPLWRGCMAALLALVAVSLPAWLALRLHGPDIGPATLFAAASLLAFGALVGRSAWRLRSPACHALRWNGVTWQTLDDRLQPTPVALSVAVDAGAWMLLRLSRPARPDAAGDGSPSGLIQRLGDALAESGRAAAWIAVSERALPLRWHALRCAVHGPVPPASPAAEAGGQL